MKDRRLALVGALLLTSASCQSDAPTSAGGWPPVDSWEVLSITVSQGPYMTVVRKEDGRPAEEIRVLSTFVNAELKYRGGVLKEPQLQVPEGQSVTLCFGNVGRNRRAPGTPAPGEGPWWDPSGPPCGLLVTLHPRPVPSIGLTGVPTRWFRVDLEIEQIFPNRKSERERTRADLRNLELWTILPRK